MPIPIFTNQKTGEPLRDPAVIDRIAMAVEREGGDVWFSADPREFLGNAYDPAEWEPVTDIIEVWFDLGSTHAFVLGAAAGAEMARLALSSKARTSIAAGFSFFAVESVRHPQAARPTRRY